MTLSLVGFISAAQAAPDTDHLKGSIVLKGEGSTNIFDGVKDTRFLDLAYAQWAWSNLKSPTDVAAELAKYKGAYKTFEQAAKAEFKPRWKVKYMSIPDNQWTKAGRELRAQVDREVFVQSPDQDAIARYRDLILLEMAWDGYVSRRAPWHAEDWEAFESFYCDRHTRVLGFVMDGCAIPNWHRPDPGAWKKVGYERLKREGRLEFLQSN
ncbi:hypothetical protein [Pseudovibrio axinellae]|uniref:hypothetical protein n=1 Tax=Pseudovibrio axinellae TaxID=989403 RepID=UPI00082E5181|nr:hypothetical protein [Pseudovibrio axinellae]